VWVLVQPRQESLPFLLAITNRGSQKSGNPWWNTITLLKNLSTGEYSSTVEALTLIMLFVNMLKLSPQKKKNN
jgi:hypothetical protein